LNGTAELFFHYLRDDTDILSLISLLSCALELVPLLASKKSSKKERKERQGAVDKLEKELDTKREALGIDEDPVMKKESRVGVTSAASKRARALLWAHLLRVDLPKELQDGESMAVINADFYRATRCSTENTSLAERVDEHLPRAQLALDLIVHCQIASGSCPSFAGDFVAVGSAAQSHPHTCGGVGDRGGD
jgi:translocation protein SEC63